MGADLPCGRIGRLFAFQGLVVAAVGPVGVVGNAGGGAGCVFHGFHRPWSRARRDCRDLRSRRYPWRFVGSMSESFRISHPSGSRSPKRSLAGLPAPETRSVRGRVQVVVTDLWLTAASCGSNPKLAHADVADRNEDRVPARVHSHLRVVSSTPTLALVPGQSIYRNNISGWNGTPSRTT